MIREVHSVTFQKCCGMLCYEEKSSNCIMRRSRLIVSGKCISFVTSEQDLKVVYSPVM